VKVLSAGPGDHVVIFHDGDRELIELVGEFLLDGLRDGGVAVVVATPRHRLSLDAWLGWAGVDVAAAGASRSYVELDAAEALGAFMVNGWPDAAGFWQLFSPLVQEAAKAGRQIRIFGEMVSLLWESGQVAAAIDVEALWNEIGARYSFTLLCGYAAQSAAGSEHSDAVAQVCAAHTSAAGAPGESGGTEPQR
jgi:hypothetical protein